MKALSATAFALVMACTSGAYAADAPAIAARMAGEVCSKCHGINGVSPSPLFPHLAGQQAKYIENELMEFRSQTRGDPHARAYMWGIAGPLNDAQIKGLAEYYTKKPVGHGVSSGDAALAAKGKTIFDQGDSAHNVPACASCHGANAEGVDATPRLAGQHGDYLIRQLEAFHRELRENETMHEVAKDITEDDIRAVAEYLASK
ncbi:MAG: c-type cytochrome [Alphaproteobacteria bacterium]|nr:c-type cytochrome [Alphaproteobacteria bacterium]